MQNAEKSEKLRFGSIGIDLQGRCHICGYVISVKWSGFDDGCQETHRMSRLRGVCSDAGNVWNMRIHRTDEPLHVQCDQSPPGVDRKTKQE